MGIYDYEAAFGAADKTSAAMRQALSLWQRLYYGDAQDREDTCQRIAFTVVDKLVKAVFGEYQPTADDPVGRQLLGQLEAIRLPAVCSALVEGECYIKPCPAEGGFRFVTVPRHNVLIFGRDGRGQPVDVGLVERSVRGNQYETLLERRQVDERGYLTVTYRLYRSGNGQQLGQQVSLQSSPQYRALQEQYRFEKPVGLGLVRIKTPALNCVDGSWDGVSIFAPAAGLIQNIDRNEQQMNGEFERAQSRVFASRDLLTQEGLTDDLFVGLDDDPDSVGITVYSPPLREGAYLARKLEYLRNVESILGLRRGMLADANIEERTATEIASSVADYNLTVLQLQNMWQQAVMDTVALCAVLGRLYGLPVTDGLPVIDWGNGVLYDESERWQEYLQLVDKGLLKPEIALGWRFGMDADTDAQQAAIRKKYMP